VAILREEGKMQRVVFGSRMLRHVRGLSLLGLLLALAIGTASASTDCLPSELDSRFCDRTGDMVADPPTDPSQWLNPDTLIFTYTPVEDPAIYQEAFAEFLEHLAEKTGKEVRYFPVTSFSAQLEAMRAERLHIAGFGAGNTINAVNMAGFVPFAIMVQPENVFGYQMLIITHVDSDIETLEDLRGREVAFVSPASNSGYVAPTALLFSELGMKPDVDYSTAFSGLHDNSIFGVFNKDYEVAAIAGDILERMVRRGLVDEDQIKIIYRSETFPTSSFGYLYNLDPQLVETIVDAFFSFEWEGTALAREFAPRVAYMPITYQEHWEILRVIRDASDAIGD
jgi:phosphonate transport system substrate-binding protein